MKLDTGTHRSLSSRTWTIGTTTLVMTMLALSAGPALAHVALDAPNGGETLEAGSVFMIEWHDVVGHGTADYDLWYSTTGPGGPWIDIALDLTPVPGAGGYSHDWAVPDTPSDQVRVRVRQDNQGADYEDISNSDLAIVGSPASETIVLEPAQDATLYEGDGTLANGAGSFLFAGRTQTQNGAVERRALLAFELTGAIPQGSTITAVSLELDMSKTTSGEQTAALHRVEEGWGEGQSVAPGQQGGGGDAEAGDATWVHRFFPDTLWSTAGGSFSSTASATQQISSVASYTFGSTAEMVTDVQGWLDEPSENHGWALVLPSPAVGSAKRFNSREHGTASSRPRLTVTYEAGATTPTADFSFGPSNPRVGEVVSFTDLSGGSPTAWEWDFGDGETSTEQNPTHVFGSTGVFTVSLIASNATGSDTATRAVTVLPDEDPELTELVIVPAAANAGGSGGAFFVTTVDLYNRGSSTASFRFLWLPRSTDNSSPQESAIFNLEPGQTTRFHNLLADVFSATDAVGAAAVLTDSDSLEVMSRTFNQTEGGTFGQSLPGVPARELIPAGDVAAVMFLTEDGVFRSNLGLVNGIDSPITVQWELFAGDGSSLGTGEVELPAWGNVQLNRVLADFAPLEAAYALVWTPTTGGAFTCYASVLDEQTSDPTTVLPR